MNLSSINDKNLFAEIKQMIQSAKQRAAAAVNSELTMLYWQAGKCIQKEVLNDDRAEYGKEVIAGLSRDLTNVFGRGWSKKQLHHCLCFAEIFADKKIVSAVRRQLSWTHIRKKKALSPSP